MQDIRRGDPPRRRTPVWAIAALAAALLLLAALWVPINRRPVPEGYYTTTWFEGLKPRGLVGTAAALLGLGPKRFVQLNMAGQLGFLFLLLLALARAGESRRSLLGLATLGVLLSFNQVILTGNFLSGFIDVHSCVLTLAALHLLALGEGQPGPSAIATAALLSGVALLNHEKSILDATILAAWLWLRFSLRPAVGYLLPVLAVLVGVVAPSSGGASMGLTVPEYFGILRRSAVFVREESGSLIGILYAGGFAWLLLAYAATALVKAKARESGGALVKSWAFLAISGIACLAPLLVAHDTTRLVGLMWLPTLLVLIEARLPARLGSSRRALGVVTLLALLQLALPPVFVFKHSAVPLNCYAQAAVRALCEHEPQEEWTALGGWLRLSEDGGHRPWYLRRCLPVRVFRH